MTPLTKVRACPHCSRQPPLTDGQPHNIYMDYLIDSISEKTTPEDFDKLCKKYLSSDDPNFDYEPRIRQTLLDRILLEGSSVLIEHVLGKYPYLLNYGNSRGETPVIRSTFGRTEKKAFKTIKILIELKADLNFSSGWGFWPDPTVLSLTAERKWKSVVQLLVDCGAEIAPQRQLSQEAQVVVDNAIKTKQVASQKFLQELCPTFLESTPLPIELVTLIAQYSYIGQTERDLSTQS
ncbi:MAG: hypothetical protein V4487_00345 [Chlamydiota bacterium]